MDTQLMFSSNTNEWATPQDIFDDLNKIYNFTLDPCASPDNHKCKKYFTIEDDGLFQTWGGRVFMNPPYGREIGKWIKKAYDEYLNGALVVCLIPSRTDTKYWHDYVMKGHIHFIKGRLKFGDSKQGAPFPSAIVVFGEDFDDKKINTYYIRKPNRINIL